MMEEPRYRVPANLMVARLIRAWKEQCDSGADTSAVQKQLVEIRSDLNFALNALGVFEKEYFPQT